MAKAKKATMGKTTKQDLLQNPINFIYLFINDDFLKLVSKYMGKKKAAIIKQKFKNQYTYAMRVWGGEKEFNASGYNDFSAAIQSQYGMTPQTILKKLLAGETVAGKNWADGVYGVAGSRTKQDNFVQQEGFTVNAETGTLSAAGTELIYGTPIYKNKGKKTIIDGYSYEIDGKVFTTKRASNGKYYANTYGDSNGTYYANGSVYTASDASSVWENIITAMPEIQKFIEWIASLFNVTLLTAKNTVPSQEEFLDDTASSSNTSISSVGIIGMALIGGFLIMGKGKKKK